ncbi:MAG: hypothetical protein JO356_17445 [Acidobacteria bacterium]|nr:hypothetical protein [Acidobacteriota bacterium]
MPLKQNFLLLCLCASALAESGPLDVQLMPHDRMMQGSAMNMATMHMDGMNTADRFLMNLITGSAVNPSAFAMPMVMKNLGSWQTMFMGQAFLVDTQQSGPRGGDKLFAPNWFMGMAEHSVGERSAFQFQLMMSLDPATVTGRRYPLLFQTGETAFGKPLVDAQHPHDLFMGIAVQYARTLTDTAVLQLSYSPVGDPALGPIAFPHRASAIEIPQATLGHHWQDSTHIANNVVTAGIAYQKIKLEASGFYGREPNENRWNIDFGPMNSWSARLWYFPTANWATQASVGRLANPEASHTGDVVRSTASVHYSHPLHNNFWSSSLIWGRNHSTSSGRNTNSYALESVLPLTRHNLITGRAELVDKDELFAADHALEDRIAARYGSTFRIGEYTIGYTHEIPFFRYLGTAIGANVEFYSLPPAIKPYYGNHPIGGNVYVRVRLKSPE